VRKTLLLISVLALVLAAGAVATTERANARTASGPACPKAWLSGWQKLANRIHTPVYCPSYLPDPLTGQIGGRWNNIDSVGTDGSYLIGFVWQELGQEIHVNLRGYPGTTKVPTCRSIDLVGGSKRVSTVPCFADSRGQKKIGRLRVTMYTVNQDADQWHVLYAWRHAGSLYTVSQHVAPPLTYPKVVQSLDRITRSLVLVDPAQ
jgi:hypothetical protein